MAAGDRLSLRLRREGLAPDLERACALGRDAGLAPEHQHRAEDLFPRPEIGLVVLDIGGGAGTIILAGGVDARGIVEGFGVGGHCQRVEGLDLLGSRPARDRVVEPAGRVGLDQLLRHRLGLGQEGPVIDLHGARRVHALPHRDGRQDVEQDEPLDPAGMVEREAIGDAGAAVMADHGEAVEAERAHRGDDVLAHGALAVERLAAIAMRRGRPAIAA